MTSGNFLAGGETSPPRQDNPDVTATSGFFPGERPPRRLRCRLLGVDLRRTRQGQSWAILDLSWRGRRLRAVVFPSQWRALRNVPDLEVGHRYVVIGSIGFSEGAPVVKVIELREQALHVVTSDGVGVAR